MNSRFASPNPAGTSEREVLIVGFAMAVIVIAAVVVVVLRRRHNNLA